MEQLSKWLGLAAGLAAGMIGALPAIAHAQDEALDGGPQAHVEVVPVLAPDAATGPQGPAGWMEGFGSYANLYWDWASRGQIGFRFDQGAPVIWQRCPDCRLSPFAKRSMAPWLSQLAQRYESAADPPDAYLLLLPPGSIEGAGFFMPSAWVATEYGFAGFAVMAADQPQAALHELGHMIGLPDRYDPHGEEASTALTLMGWIDAPAAPVDPVLRSERGWAFQHSLVASTEAATVALGPDDVLQIVVGQQWYWLGVQPILGEEGPTGWLVEVDRSDPGAGFIRMYEKLVSASQPSAGIVTLAARPGDLSLAWQFLPSSQRLVATVALVPARTGIAAGEGAAASPNRGAGSGGAAGLLLGRLPAWAVGRWAPAVWGGGVALAVVLGLGVRAIVRRRRRPGSSAEAG